MSDDTKITISKVLLPLSILSFAVAMFFAFQTSQILRERDVLHEARGQQDKAFVESQKLQAQLSALVLGTQKLSEQGDKNVKEIADRLKEMGVVAAENKDASALPPNAASAKNPPVPVAPEKSPAKE